VFNFHHIGESLKALFLSLSILFSTNTLALTFDQYLKKPKLVLVVVIDQFRADFLKKFQKTFIPEHNKNEVGGFNYLMKNSAFFPNGEYNVLQSMTCPGHAMIMTGSQPHDTGIVLNEWFDKKSNKKVYCAYDEEYKLSPRKLLTTTLGDELKSVDKYSRVFSLALKDRSAIMLGGHRADLALWMDFDEMKWTTSPYYAKEIPSWAESENIKLIKDYKISKENSKEAKKDFATYLGVKITTDMAIKVLQSQNLGKGDSTDMLTISYSTHDMTGHTNGPDSLEVKAITHIEDRDISRLLNSVKKSLGSLDDVTIVLTADHGIAPNIETSKSYKIDSDKIDYDVLYKKINEKLNFKFGNISKNWLKSHRSFNLYLDEEIISDKKLSKKEVEAELKKVLKDFHGVKDVATSTEIAQGIYPQGELGEQVKRQYLEGISGDVLLIPMPFYMEKDDNCVTHMTGYSYDRTVPIIIKSKNIKNGVYSGGNVIDIAPTLSHILQILPPATSSGKVLQEIFK
jgi:predicted AlkP superfamily pyrophosphatase or phosphodiesterase